MTRAFLVCTLLAHSFSYPIIAVASPAKPTFREKPCAVVTGVSRFVAGHIVELLLQKGYDIYGLQELSNSSEDITHLHNLGQTYSALTNARFYFFDVTNGLSSQYVANISKCIALFHTLSPTKFISNAVDVKNHVERTINVLSLAVLAGISRVVLTSSQIASSSAFSSICNKDDYSRIDAKVSLLDRGNMNVVAYIQANIAVEDWIQHHLGKQNNSDTSSTKYKLHASFLHFADAWGPYQSARTKGVRSEILDALAGRLPVYYPLYYHTVDIRDVARAHIHIMESKKAEGHFIVSHGQLTLISMADIGSIVRMTPELDTALYLPLPFTLPSSLFKLLIPYVDSLCRDVLYTPRLGPECRLDGARLVQELNFVYKHESIVATVRDTIASLLQVGVLANASSESIPRPWWHVHAVILALLTPVLLTTLSFSLHFFLRCICCRVPRRRVSRRGYKEKD